MGLHPCWSRLELPSGSFAAWNGPTENTAAGDHVRRFASRWAWTQTTGARGKNRVQARTRGLLLLPDREPRRRPVLRRLRWHSHPLALPRLPVGQPRGQPVLSNLRRSIRQHRGLPALSGDHARSPPGLPAVRPSARRETDVSVRAPAFPDRSVAGGSPPPPLPAHHTAPSGGGALPNAPPDGASRGPRSPAGLSPHRGALPAECESLPGLLQGGRRHVSAAHGHPGRAPGHRSPGGSLLVVAVMAGARRPLTGSLVVRFEPRR